MFAYTVIRVNDNDQTETFGINSKLFFFCNISVLFLIELLLTILFILDMEWVTGPQKKEGSKFLTTLF